MLGRVGPAGLGLPVAPDIVCSRHGSTGAVWGQCIGVKTNGTVELLFQLLENSFSHCKIKLRIMIHIIVSKEDGQATPSSCCGFTFIVVWAPSHIILLLLMVRMCVMCACVCVLHVCIMHDCVMYVCMCMCIIYVS